MDEFLSDYGTEIQKVRDVTQKASPVYYNEQIDQMILTPDVRSSVISKKVPRMVKKPIFALDEANEKIPLLDTTGNVVVNEAGEVKYVISDYSEEQEGWQSELDVIPASEIFSVDNATGNISQEAVNLITRTYWFFNLLSVYQTMTKLDYSIYLHKLRNDAVTVLQASKSYNGSTVQAIKTFINKTDTKQWLQKEEEEKKAGPLAWLTGGTKKKKSDDSNSQKFTGYS